MAIGATVVQVMIILLHSGITSAADGLRGQRIAGGVSTTLGEYPFVLSLGLTSWAGVYHLHYCAGSILTESWTITSAKCVEEFQELEPSIGDHYTFNAIVFYQVKIPFEFSASIQPVELWTSISDGTPSVDSNVVAVGWGQVSQTLIQPDTLKSAEFTIITGDACREVYSPWIEANITVYDDYQFCAVSTKRASAEEYVADVAEEEEESTFTGRHVSYRSACHGDEGGPLFLIDAGIPLCVGVVSWTYGCDSPEYPTVFVKISAYFDWIYESTGYWI
ncbi:trypsin-1-like [Athalia rosae]|uniref:trypsin-1-like n=1 Tax=Athalia rosae TaxID=37344 RepID=UPI002033E410|nr:trypsin-1-like [Athalia rosae]